MNDEALDLHDWAASALGLHRHDVHLTYLRRVPWSAVTAMMSPIGRHVVKSPALCFSHESRIIQYLTSLGVSSLPQIVAARQDGTFIMEDGGVDLRTMLDDDNTPAAIGLAARAMAHLQIATIGKENELLRLGIDDRRPSRIPSLFKAHLDAGWLQSFDGADDSDVERYRALLPVLEDAITDLEAITLPTTIVHGDFHDGNILVDGKTITLIDHAEVSISHPFFAMTGLTYALSKRSSPETAARNVAAARNNYLGVWADWSSRHNIVAAMELAERISAITYILSYRPLITCLDPKDASRLRGNMSSALEDMLKEVHTSPQNADWQGP